LEVLSPLFAHPYAFCFGLIWSNPHNYSKNSCCVVQNPKCALLTHTTPLNNEIHTNSQEEVIGLKKVEFRVHHVSKHLEAIGCNILTFAIDINFNVGLECSALVVLHSCSHSSPHF
jgi:hypothetical protein